MNIIWNNANEWMLEELSRKKTARRSGINVTSADALPDGFIASSRVTIEKEFGLTPSPQARRAAGLPLIDFTVQVARDESSMLVLRHPSGAITFHQPEIVTSAKRGARASSAKTLRFRVPVRSADTGARRSFTSKAIKAIILKISGIVADMLLPSLARKWEERTWKKKTMVEGWLRVDKDSLRQGKLVPFKPDAATLGAGRSLLLLHGTFSSTVGAFQPLAESDFFNRVAELYGNRIFAFDHFSISRTPQENVRMLIESLPEGRFSFDVVTHSRGALMLRHMVEREAAFEGVKSELEIGRVVLVAAPNEGTPLASPSRWQDMIGWFANALELFPDNTFTVGAELIAEAIIWMAERASGGLPGIGAMDVAGELIESLRNSPGSPSTTYSALVANYRTDGALWQRMIDVGVDVFFGSANDLIVPTEGGWRIDKDGLPYIPASRIGCYGLGGNLLSEQSNAVHHTNFFRQSETVDFLVNALSGKEQNLTQIDLLKPLPDRRFFRSVSSVATETKSVQSVKESSASRTASDMALSENMKVNPLIEDNDTLHLIVLNAPQDPTLAQLLATYGSARVLEPFETKGEANEAGKRFQQIIRVQERIRNYTDGKPNSSLPDERELIDYGKLLFETLFPGKVRRLYDAVRSQRHGRKLDLIFTSMIPWIADKPWEFAYDPTRCTFLATEEMHFIRNVLTAVPAEIIRPRAGQLRILVVVAQPVGSAQLSSAEEEAVIRRGFEPLIEAGLVCVDILLQATPGKLHGWVSNGDYDVVHFIGHGEFDKDTNKGYLLFEDGRGAPHLVDDRTIREILCGRNVRLVFLNACETGRGGRVDFNSGVAPALVAGGIQAVVANQFKVLDPSATSFAQHFCWSLARGMTLGEAARESRIAVNYSISGENIDWAVPVVYARDPNARLCYSAPTESRSLLLPAVTQRRRRAIAAHQYRVAVWDVAHTFPGLDETLTRMNTAQTLFGFEMVDLSAPIGTWTVDSKKTGQPVAYLQADLFAEKFKNIPQDLGVDYLICLTDQPIAYENDKDEAIGSCYVCWHDRSVPVSLFSSASLNLLPRGRQTDRVLTNAMVRCLAGMLAGIGTHERPPKMCPFYSEKERSLRVMAGKLTFDARCRKVLEEKIADALPGLEKLLRIFHS